MDKPNPQHNQCPHCGGTTGFTWVEYTRIEKYCPWGGSTEDIDTGEPESTRSMNKTANCQDCGKRVPNPFNPENHG